MIPYGFLPENGKFTVSKVIVDYCAEPDCCDGEDNYQTLRLETEDGGGGHFVRMSIVEGKHFSVNGVEELQEIFEDFEKRVNEIK